MEPIVEFVAADAKGVISKETWRATAIHCPRCGNKQASVWVLVSEPPIIVMGSETRVFLCVSCLFTGFGLNGFPAGFDKSRRAQQIIELGLNAVEDLP
jgi:hypothetical protein